MNPTLSPLRSSACRISGVLAALVFFPALSIGELGDSHLNYDVVVVGATPAGIAAAISAEREGLEAVVVDEHERIGGLVTSGLSNTDIRTLQSQGGIWKEFADRVLQRYALEYGQNSSQVEDCFHGLLYEPKVALAVFEDMVREAGVEVLSRYRLVGTETDVSGKRPKLTAIHARVLESGHRITLEGKAFVDATYEGDLFAAAGAAYRLGTDDDRGRFPQRADRFPQDVFGGLQYDDTDQHHVMGINFRVLVTRNPDLRIPFPKPENYDPSLHQDIVDAVRSGEDLQLQNLIQILELPNDKANLNDQKLSVYSGFSLYNESDEWPEASPKKRREIWADAKWKAENFFYFLANDERLPRHVREGMAEWGYSRDEFEDSGHFPSQVYIREGRRLKGVATATARELEPDGHGVRAPFKEDAVAISDYGMSSHGTHIGPDGREYGNFEFATRPYQLSYGIMIPEDLDGLIVPVGVSSTQVAFGGIRMEPTWMALAQAAGFGIAQALEEERELRDVNVSRIQEKLHRDGALTFYTADVYPDSPYFRAVQFFGNRGLFQDLQPSSMIPSEGNPWGRHILGQYFGPVLGHEIEPFERMTDDLARRWIRRVNRSFGRSLELASFGREVEEWSRGRFLNRLYALTNDLEAPEARPEGQASSEARPNILLILADDLGIEALSSYGGATYQTPNLDRLAREGTRFSHAFATPLCTPSRVQLLTGQYPVRTGWSSLIHKRPRDDRYVSPKIPTVAQILRRAGYATCISGKWQLGYLGRAPDHPNRMGFDTYALWEWRDYENFKLTSCYGNPVIRRDGAILDGLEDRFGPDVHAEFIIDHIREDRDRPWFVFYPMILTHFPFVPPPELWNEESPPEEAVGFPPNKGEPNYFPWMIRHMDGIIGRLFATLEETDQLNDTLIVFLGDNGTDPAIRSSYHGQMVQGEKGELTAGGCRVPLIVYQPSRFPAGAVVDAMVDVSDVFPTLLGAAGVNYEGHLDGRDLRKEVAQAPGTEGDFSFSQIDDRWRVWNHRIAVDHQGRIFDVSSPFHEQELERHPDAASLLRQVERILGRAPFPEAP